MLPLLLVTFFIYYTTIQLLIWLSRHFMLREQFHTLDDAELQTRLKENNKAIKTIFLENASSIREVTNHYKMIRHTYLPPIDRRIRFLAIIVTTGPLLGLLGTVTGMLSTFEGMQQGQGNKFNEIVHGISEALITTQTGLIIAVPAMILLSLILQRRHTVARAIARLEILNMRLIRTSHHA